MIATPHTEFAAFQKHPVPFLIEGEIQHYDWGQSGPEAFIPRLLNRFPEPGVPYAELWLGAHPLKPSRGVYRGGQAPLDVLIQKMPGEILGSSVSGRFGPRLPYLMKVLAVSKSLSIQAHPNKEQAREGFEREEKLAIPKQAPQRNYKDDQHKPELIVALDHFYALCRFRPWRSIAEQFLQSEILRGLMDGLPAPEQVHAEDKPSPLKELYRRTMTLSQEEVNRVLTSHLERTRRDIAGAVFNPEDIRHWMLRCDQEFSKNGHKDRGLFAFLMLNLVHLQPGQGLFLNAGELHAYLQGIGVEVMANSDNVLRGGLTSKHVDVPELLRLLLFSSKAPEVLSPNARGIYRTDADEFELSQIRLEENEKSAFSAGHSAEIILVISGAVEISAKGANLSLTSGQSALVPAAAGEYEIRGSSRQALVYKTSARL
jgi:mannose-6-phosphate isomerase